MSSYSGGVSISQVSAYNSNPNIYRKIAIMPNYLRIYNAVNATSENTDITNNDTFFPAVARGDGTHSLAVPVNISAGINLLNTSGRGFIGAIVLPVFATQSGNLTLRFVIDGITKDFVLPCLNNSYRYVFLPYKMESEGDGIGIVPTGGISGIPLLQTARIYDIGKYINELTAIRFETAVQIRLSSPTALMNLAGYNTYAVQCLKDLA